jgi:ABC-type thiamine transport system substrate-binding protein
VLIFTQTGSVLGENQQQDGSGKWRLVRICLEAPTPMVRDNFAMPVGAPHPENAKTFINYMMPPEFADLLVSTDVCIPAAQELRDKIWTRLKG